VAIEMSRFRHDRRRLREQAFSNPIRVMIVELFTQDRDRQLTAKALACDLAAAGGHHAKVSVSQVGYHLACLRDAELIPRSLGRNQHPL
jgi:DNA-binding transcriptional ArsR family regulator